MSIAEHRSFAPVLERIKSGNVILGALITALLAAASIAFVFCCYRACLPLEIDPNEAWNAWQSKSLAHLYPAADALTVNNYPPLYFHFLHAFASLGAEEVYAGRVISLLASLALTFLVYRAAIILGATRLAAGIGAIWFLATLAGAYTGYAGMNDPHLLGMAVMGVGFTWFIERANKGKATEPAVLLMILAGFIKHSLLAIPASALIWLAFDRPREAARTAAFGAAACAAGLLVCYAVYGGAFFEQLLTPRAVGWKNAHLALTYAAPLIGAAAICIAWLVYDRRSRLAQKMAVLLGLTFLSGFVQSLGDGLDVNAYFEFLFALAIGVGMAFSKIQASPASAPRATKQTPPIRSTGEPDAARFAIHHPDQAKREPGSHKGGRFKVLRSRIRLRLSEMTAAAIAWDFHQTLLSIRLALAAVLLTALAFSSQAEPYKFAFSRDFRRDVVENVDAVRSEVRRLKKIPGSVSCSVMLVCYWAGKPFVWDDFAMGQRVATGKWTEAEKKRQARLHHIRFETIDDRTVW